MIYLRIIAGEAKGFRLSAPKGWAVRPTGDRVKESMFGILGDEVIDAKVLDLFAGTGNLGLECLSRGALKVIFVDKSIQCIKIVSENAQRAKLATATVIFREDSFVAIKKLASNAEVFDLIFCDPPYNQGYVEKLMNSISLANILRMGGTLIVEHSKHEIPDCHGGNFIITRTEQYGETWVSFLTKQEVF